MIHIVANWKMNKNSHEAISFINDFVSLSKKTISSSICRVLIAPPLIHLPILASQPIDLVSQNISFAENGAYTGEVSVDMISDYVSYSLVGHSERRQYFNEDSDILLRKLSLCFQYNITPIFCFGENSEDRKTGNYLSVIEEQLNSTLLSLEFNPLNIILAYEPVWAIGTGEHAHPDQINEVHNYVRAILGKKNQDSIPSKIPILYGGSCNSLNAKSILSQENVDGLLIGGASLDVQHFLKIIKIANEIY